MTRSIGDCSLKMQFEQNDQRRFLHLDERSLRSAFKSRSSYGHDIFFPFQTSSKPRISNAPFLETSHLLAGVEVRSSCQRLAIQISSKSDFAKLKDWKGRQTMTLSSTNRDLEGHITEKDLSYNFIAGGNPYTLLH